MGIYTKYGAQGGGRVIGFNTSKDGIEWSKWTVIANIDQGHYDISGECKGKISVVFDYHPYITTKIRHW